MLRTSFTAQGVCRGLLERFLRRYRRLRSAALQLAAGQATRSLKEKLAERLSKIIAKLPRHCKPGMQFGYRPLVREL
jgi:hypothetical protein